MTPRLRARIFGLNAARVYGLDVEEVTRRAAADEISRARAAYEPDPHFLTFGPKTRAQFLRLRAAHGNQPG
jgi:uncharacterized protein